MLVLTMRPAWTGTDQYIRVDGPCIIRVQEVHRNNVKISLEADPSVKILRGQLDTTEEGGNGKG